MTETNLPSTKIFSGWRHRHILWACVFVGWMLIALSFTLNYYFFSSHYVAIFKDPPTLAKMLIWEIPYWLLWIALAPVVFNITQRFPFGRPHWLRNSLVHIAACLILTVGHRAVYLIVCWLLDVEAYRQLATLIELYRSDILFNLPTGFMSYGTILLVGSVMDYYERYQAGELKASRLETELARAELQALRMQLHPHFLFNTLNSISALQLTDVEAANKMTARLGDFLRMTLDSAGVQEVTLRQEMEFLRCYLEIERIRFQDRLDVTMEIEPESLDVQVPNLILQPIVENSIRHAVVLRAATGHIQIRAQLVNGFLHMQVEDDGPGLQLSRNGNRADRGGIGLTNTRARLQQLYGRRQGFELADVSQGGLLVTLKIPLDRNHD